MAMALLVTTTAMAGCSRATEAPERATQASPQLSDLVDQALADFRRLRVGTTLGAHPYAWAAEAVAIRRGWDHPRVATYLRKVYRRQNPDGGYGPNAPWDAFGDGSVNPADTTYAINLTDHVGPVFLNGYKAGVVPRWRVRQIIRLVEKFPLATVGGTCVAYSTEPVDAPWCVGNVNASAAYFLVRTHDAGFDVDLSRVRGIVRKNRATLIDGEWWPYSSAEPWRQDWYHNVTMVEASLTLDPPLGRRTLAAMRRATVDNPWEQAAMLKLAPFDCRLADPRPLEAALAQHAGDAYYTALLAYEGAVALEACGN